MSGGWINVPISRLGGRTTALSVHVRVQPNDAERTYEAVCLTCAGEMQRDAYPVGPIRKYYGVANRDAVLHHYEQHGEPSRPHVCAGRGCAHVSHDE